MPSSVSVTILLSRCTVRIRFRTCWSVSGWSCWTSPSSICSPPWNRLPEWMLRVLRGGSRASPGPERRDQRAQARVAAIHEEDEHRPVHRQVPGQLRRAIEEERRVERDARDDHDRLREGAADQEHPEEDLDAAGQARELQVAEREPDALRDVEVGLVVKEVERERGV